MSSMVEVVHKAKGGSTMYFCIKPEIDIASFLSCLRVTTKDKVTLPMYGIAV